MAAGDLTTLANVRAALKVATTDTGDDAYITALVTRASSFIKRYCRREILDPGADVTEIHDGRGRSKIRLRDWPVITLTSVHEDSESLFPGSTLVPSTDYIVDKRLGVIVRPYGVAWLRYDQSVKVIYRPGYTTTPADVEQACIELVVGKWLRRRNEGVASKSLGDGSVAYFSASEITRDIARVLDLYKNGRMP